MATTRQKKGTAEDSHEEQIMEKICNKVLARFEQMLDRKFAEMENKFSEMAIAFEVNKQATNETKKSLKTLELEQDYLEQMRRKNNLRINGLSETANEDLLETVLKFINENLKIKCTINDIDEVYRSKNSNADTAIKPIIIKFVSNIKKNEVLQARKRLKDLKIGRISIFEDLTNKRYHIFRLARIKYGNKSVWTMGGKVYAQTGNGRELLSLDDVQ